MKQYIFNAVEKLLRLKQIQGNKREQQDGSTKIHNMY